jgi:hypothetical protein
MATEKKENWRKKQSSYYENNREAWNEYQREYKKKRYSEDEEYRLRLKEYGKIRRETIKNEIKKTT